MAQKIPVTKFLKEHYKLEIIPKTDPFHLNTMLRSLICYKCAHKNKKSLLCDNNCVTWLNFKDNTCDKFKERATK
jgi:hypothetical protein